jgi:hypothetical protein
MRPAVVQVAAATPAPAYSSAGCDPDAAFDPSRLCQPVRQAAAEPVAAAAVYSSADCDPDAAYDPSQPCKPLPRPVEAPVRAPIVAQPLPSPPVTYAARLRPVQEMTALRASYEPVPPPGRWAIQVGAFASLSTAEAAAQNARMAAPDLLRTAKIELPATTPFGSQVAFRARLLGLTQATAAEACGRLSGRGMACIAVPPDRGSF